MTAQKGRPRIEEVTYEDVLYYVGGRFLLLFHTTIMLYTTCVYICIIYEMFDTYCNKLC
jgi:hypothetical protein